MRYKNSDDGLSDQRSKDSLNFYDTCVITVASTAPENRSWVVYTTELKSRNKTAVTEAWKKGVFIVHEHVVATDNA